jgi:hypothetical protein
MGALVRCDRRGALGGIPYLVDGAGVDQPGDPVCCLLDRDLPVLEDELPDHHGGGQAADRRQYPSHAEHRWPLGGRVTVSC